VLEKATTLLPRAEVIESPASATIRSPKRQKPSRPPSGCTRDAGDAPRGGVHRARWPRFRCDAGCRDELVGEGAIRVAVRAAGVNFPDYLLTRANTSSSVNHRSRREWKSPAWLPRLGHRCPGSRPWPIGTPVIAVSSLGGFAEQIVVPNDAAFALPERFSYADGATFLIAAHTAYHALVDRAELRAKDTVLVLGATAVSATPQCS